MAIQERGDMDLILEQAEKSFQKATEELIKSSTDDYSPEGSTKHASIAAAYGIRALYFQNLAILEYLKSLQK